MPLVLIDRIVIDPLRCAERLSTVGAPTKHHVSAVAGARRYNTGHHVKVIVSRSAGTIRYDECLPAEPYSIHSPLNEVATHVNLSHPVKTRCLTPVLCIAGTHAPKRASSSGKKEVAVGIDVHRTGIGRVGNINRGHPRRSAVRGTVEFSKVTSKEPGPKLVDESMSHTAHVRIDGKPFLIATMPRFIRRLLREGLTTVG